MGSPFRATTGDEKEILQKLVDDLAERFVGLVRTHRGLDAGQIEKIAAAGIFLPREALALGLVDEIGYLSDAEARAKSLAGLSDNASLVVYRRNEYANDTVYNPSASAAAGSNLSLFNLELPGGMSDLSAGFYYMWIPGLDQE
jgi:protease IV